MENVNSNPATLREALLQFPLAMGFAGTLQEIQEWWTDIVAPALTASGTEAALSYPRSCGLCPNNIESEDDLDWHGLGNCVDICVRCHGSGQEPELITPADEAELAKLEAKGVKWVRSQAAASPEGEGREAYPGQKFFHERNVNIRNCDQFKEDVEFIHACHIEGSIDVACRQVFERREKEALERALRQSAAPSEGAALWTGTCDSPFVAAGSKQLGIAPQIIDRCELQYGHAGQHKNGNASWGVQRESEIPAGLIEELDRQVHGNDSGWHACVLCGCPERGAHFPACIVAKMRQRESEQPEALREAVRDMMPLIELYAEREINSPANHQEFARETKEKLRRLRAALSPQTDSQEPR